MSAEVVTNLADVLVDPVDLQGADPLRGGRVAEVGSVFAGRPAASVRN